MLQARAPSQPRPLPAAPGPDESREAPALARCSPEKMEASLKMSERREVTGS